MKSRSLLEAFEINKKSIPRVHVNDYEVFKDKALLDTLRVKVMQHLVDKEIDGKDSDFVNKEIEECIEGYDLSNKERSHLFTLINDELNGYGPLTTLLNDPDVTEIMINSPKEIFVEINGEITQDETISFIDNDHIIRTVERLISPIGKVLDHAHPMVDSRLQDGSRINAVIPPLSVKGPVVTIRKFQKKINDIDELIGLGSLTPGMADFLLAAILGRLNILICGASSTGKTTLLNILGSFIPNDERIITIEDVAELKIDKRNLVSLETRTLNYEDNGEITIRDLVRNSLRMRPDRIIIGEVRGKEAFDVLQAMNTGHDGSITTIHANSPKEALNRLETLVLMNKMELSIKAVREYIVDAIDLVINIERLSNGKRKITSISEVVGLDDEEIIIKEIYGFKIKGFSRKKEINGEFIQHDYIPKALNKIKASGIDFKEKFKEAKEIEEN